jgi:pimeloyl-ACP methyl ester carboxylesterase
MGRQLEPVVYRRAEVPSAVVLLLHGGREAAVERPGLWNPPALRLRTFVGGIGRAVPEAVVCRVRYRHRGWNGDRADAARDAEAALEWLVAEFGTLPAVLVGHSMGGRAALRTGGHPAVRGVIGLAPWCPTEDPVVQLAGRQVALLHSDQDTVTAPEASWRCVERAGAAGAAAFGVEIGGSDHAMLRRGVVWQELTARLVRRMLGEDGAGAGRVDLRLPQGCRRRP